MSKLRSKRIPVTLRFNLEEKSVLTSIIKKEFGPQIALKDGLRSIIINTANGYIKSINEQKKEQETASNNEMEITDAESARNTSDGDSEAIHIRDVDSPVPSNPPSNVDTPSEG